MKKSFWKTGLLFLLLVAAVSCGQEQDIETAEKVTVPAAAETTAEIEIKDAAAFVPEGVFFDDVEFTVLASNQWLLYAADWGVAPYNEVVPTDYEGGDLVNEAVTARNRMTEEKLGITIRCVEAKDEQLAKTVSASVMAGDNAYDAVCAEANKMYACAIQGLLCNLSDVDTLDLSHAWWDQKTRETFDFGIDQSAVYFMTGDINYVDNLSTECIIANKTLLESMELPMPYDLVREKKWTFDRMFEMLRGSYHDLDADGKKSFGDQYGLCGTTRIIPLFMVSMDQQQFIKENNSFFVNETEKYFTILNKVFDTLTNSDSVWLDGGEYSQIFRGARALFSEDVLNGFIRASSEMDDDSGVLPFPLYDENQESYFCPVQVRYSTAYGIVRNTDTSLAGYVLDVMGAYSHDTVTEAVIEKNCKIKKARDEDTAEMLDIIMKTSVYELARVTEWGSVDKLIDNIQNGIHYSSDLAKKKSSAEKAAAEAMEVLGYPEE